MRITIISVGCREQFTGYCYREIVPTFLRELKTSMLDMQYTTDIGVNIGSFALNINYFIYIEVFICSVRKFFYHNY